MSIFICLKLKCRIYIGSAARLKFDQTGVRKFLFRQFFATTKWTKCIISSVSHKMIITLYSVMRNSLAPGTGTNWNRLKTNLIIINLLLTKFPISRFYTY
jgi:hypothetical protein